MSRVAAAAALACTVVLVSSPSHARGFRFGSAAKVISVKSAAAAPAAAARNNTSVFIATGSRPAAAPQQAAGDPARGPSLYNPTPVSADAKPAAADSKAELPKELTAAPNTECAVKEQSPAKDKEMVATQEAAKIEPAKTEPTRSRSAFLVPVANRHPLAPPPRRAVVCYVQRDGTCSP